MIRDDQDTYCKGQAPTAVASTDSTNTLDKLAFGDANNAMWLYIRVGTAFTTGSGGTLAANLVTADDTGFSTNVVTFPLFPATAVASLTANTVMVREKLPVGMRRYSKVVWVIATGTMTAGTVDAFLTPDVQTNR